MRVKLTVRSIAWVVVAVAAYAAGFCLGAGIEERRMRPWMSVLKEGIDLRKRLLDESWRQIEELEAKASHECRIPDGARHGEATR